MDAYTRVKHQKLCLDAHRDTETKQKAQKALNSQDEV
jgi:hypothetical protein